MWETTVSGVAFRRNREPDGLIPGSIDVAIGGTVPDYLNRPAEDDVRDDLGERVGKAGGEVVIVPTARMSTKSGAAAISRY